VFTTVDYGPAPIGSDHVLYLITGRDGQLETNACIGSHSGPPDPVEVAFFGAGTAAAGVPPVPNVPSAVTATAPPGEVAAPPVAGAGSSPPIPALVAIGTAAIAALVLGLRRVARTAR
jgi:hypothetical protein